MRYGVNILESGWNRSAKASKAVAYYAEAVENGVFAYEWINPRFGRPIREVRAYGNDLHLASIRMVPRLKAPDPNPLRLLGPPFRAR